MEKKELTALPAHLKPLVAPTPSGVAKLISAWDGLSVEAQIQIITSLDERRLAPHLLQRVRRKALDSPNAYVRYLAARGVRVTQDPNEEEKALRSRIEADPDPLVRYSLQETEGMFFDAQVFFSLPQEARLATVRELSGSGETVASLVAYALDNYVTEGKVSQIELYEILVDYLTKPAFREYYAREGNVWVDGDIACLVGKDLEALWELAVRVPPEISPVLIDHLPEKAGLSSGIPQKVIDRLTPRQLTRLLRRTDIALTKLRRSIFARPVQDSGPRDALRAAAVSSNFDLSYDEFAEILAKPRAEKIPILKDLAAARDLKLVLYEALYDILARDEGGFYMAGEARANVAPGAHTLRGRRRDYELREFRFYIAARLAVPWGAQEQAYPPSGGLEFLAKLCVPGDTWATFRNFSKEWASSSADKERNKLLPSVEWWLEGACDGASDAGEEVSEGDNLGDRIGGS